MLRSDGKPAASFADTINASLTAREVEDGRLNGYRYSKRFALKPGFYEVLVGVRDTASDMAGTTKTWVEIPDLRNGEPVLSSIHLGKATDKAQRPGGGDKLPPQFLTGRASFKNGDTAIYRFVAYNAKKATAPEPLVRLEILRGESLVYVSDLHSLSSRSIRTTNKGVELGGQIPVALEPGLYQLRVTLQNGNSKKRSAEQTFSFEVEP